MNFPRRLESSSRARALQFEVLAHLFLNAVAERLDVDLGFAKGRLGAVQGGAVLADLALQVGCLLEQVQVQHAVCQVALHQLLADRYLFLQERQPLPLVAEAGRYLGDLLEALVGQFPVSGELVLGATASGLEHFVGLFHQVQVVEDEVVGNPRHRGVREFRLEARDVHPVGSDAGFEFLDIGAARRRFQNDQGLAALHAVALADQKLAHDPALQVLDALHLAGGDDLAHGAADDVELAEMGPYQEGDHQSGAQHDERMGAGADGLGRRDLVLGRLVH